MHETCVGVSVGSLAYRRELERLSEDRNIFSRTPINGHMHDKFAKKHIKLEVTASPWNFEKGVYACTLNSTAKILSRRWGIDTMKLPRQK